jgi:hypothetical protein
MMISAGGPFGKQPDGLTGPLLFQKLVNVGMCEGRACPEIWLEAQKIVHTRGTPYHPMTQGKAERWHQTLKNPILLESYYLPGDLEAQIDAFVAYYNRRC